MNAEKENILAQNCGVVAELFELDEPDIVPEARLYEDLDIDSIDAVDLLTDLKKTTKVEITPPQFNKVKTVQDVVDVSANFSVKRNTQ
ncbi:acyl carrier protein [Alteromonas pelagimontana]|uniref:Acyl carrier protein n=1 Tax=Alteromonas pelagimontana TaxID=1858656 RepID=A0A6M4MD52_9ALTE|nr:acyl carrier protein [Alteromonas pelagimontana]QJR80937.1 acyl carrier protein [Alteromonas pelagimontana]